MKRILYMAAVALVMVMGSSFINSASAQYDQSYDDQYDDRYDQDRDVSYQTFYDELSPHGRWVDYPGQGYVWVPDAGPDFRPYSTNGHWVWSDNYEWVWVSDYDWGWAPFHYGRWDMDPYYGWYWVPGYEWSPAWVAWRDGGDYYGWAPIRPGINISINFNIGSYSPPVDFWCFTPRRYITSPRVYDYYVDRRQNVTIINYTTIINNNYHYGGNYGFRAGPRRYDAERYCGVINPVRFRASYTPGRASFRNNEVSIYRPNVRRDNNRNFAPRSVERYDRNAGGFRNNDNRAANNSNNRFDRRDDNRPSNNLPSRGGRFDRNDNNGTVSQPGNSPDRRRFERNDNTPGNQPGNNPDRRRFERNDNTPGNQPGNNPDRRRFERSDNTPANQPGNGNGFPGNRRAERPDNGGQQPGNSTPSPDRRRFERPNNGGGVTNTPPVRQQPRQDNFPQRQPQMERRMENRQPQQQPQRQVEQRRFEPRSTTSQPSRQMERREPGGGGGNNGGGAGRGRRF